jgi:2-C-methyl-D-erythritol 4-phosphate cytidylyltransferase/2-C-methyl-D-erythritol 2,4-cyclodiphosphate synthase
VQNFSNIAVIVAGGDGTRMGLEIPKQYAKLGERSVLYHTVKVFLSTASVDKVCVVIGAGHEQMYYDAIDSLVYSLLPTVYGGDSRQDSVRAGLEAIEQYNPSKVLIHDAARPFVSVRLIEEVLVELDHYQAVLPVVRMVDTLKMVKDGQVLSTLDRSQIYGAQTPQGFDYRTILDLHRKYSQVKGLTDDVQLCEKENIAVKAIINDENNIKLTTNTDLQKWRLLTVHTNTKPELV